jgi:hypothetical protein
MYLNNSRYVRDPIDESFHLEEASYRLKVASCSSRKCSASGSLRSQPLLVGCPAPMEKKRVPLASCLLPPFTALILVEFDLGYEKAPRSLEMLGQRGAGKDTR